MTISHSRPLTIVLSSMALIAVLSVASRGRAEDPTAAPSKPSDTAKPAGTGDVQQWAKDLDSDTFATRQEADRKLFAAGKEAVGPLAEAAAGKSLEVTNAAVDILQRLSQSSDTATRDAAKAALEKLAQGPNATAAGLAKEALTPPPSPNAQPAGPNIGGNIQIGPGGGIRIFGGGGGNIQIAPGGGAIQVFRIQTNANGGNRSVDVDDNGKKVHIQEDQNGIEMRVTEKVNGQDKTDTFKAKDAAELKQKFPDAHKLYEKYGQNGVGNIQIQAQAIGVPNFGPAIPAIPIALNAVPHRGARRAIEKEAADQIDEARKLITEATDNLKKNAAPQGNDSTQKAIEKLDAAGQKLDEAHQKLGG